jgi:hypothetical protein
LVAAVEHLQVTDAATPSFVFVALQSACCDELGTVERGEIAVYMARWINTRGERGPSSEVTTAAVAA